MAASSQNNTSPAKWTYANIAAMRAQLQSMGLSLDWSREIATCDPSYYKHQQKLFLDFLAAGLVARKKSKVNWDPVDQTEALVISEHQGIISQLLIFDKTNHSD